MDLDTLVHDVCIFSFGWKWNKSHDELHEYLTEVLKRYREDIYEDTDPANEFTRYPKSGT